MTCLCPERSESPSPTSGGAMLQGGVPHAITLPAPARANSSPGPRGPPQCFSHTSSAHSTHSPLSCEVQTHRNIRKQEAGRPPRARADSLQRSPCLSLSSCKLPPAAKVLALRLAKHRAGEDAVLSAVGQGRPAWFAGLVFRVNTEGKGAKLGHSRKCRFLF